MSNQAGKSVANGMSGAHGDARSGCGRNSGEGNNGAGSIGARNTGIMIMTGAIGMTGIEDCAVPVS